MKNTFLKPSLLLLLLSINLTILAQERVADIRVEFTDPIERTVVYSPGTLVITTKIVNQGPDSLMPTDTFFYSIGHTYYQDVPRNRIPINKIVPPNDSFYIYDSLPLDISADVRNLYVGHRDGVTGCKAAASDSRQLAKEFWEGQKDNYPSLRLYHERKNVGVQKVDLSDIKLVPNPTSDRTFIIHSDTKKFESIVIYSVSGKIILESPLIGDRVLLPQDTPSNMYFVKLFNNEEVVVKRLVLQ